MHERAELVARLVMRAVKRRCFIAMPFCKEFKEVEDAILRAFDGLAVVPVKTDQLDRVGDVIETIRNSIAACECAIAVITGGNPNVMYELGLLHAVGKPTVLLYEVDEAGRLPELPFD